jgi:hypothetical protein
MKKVIHLLTARIRLSAIGQGTWAIVTAISLNSLLVPIALSQEPKASEVQNPMHQQALLALEDIAAESKAYDDKVLQIQVQAQVADMLWSIEPERAKDLISSAFDSVDTLKEDIVKRYHLRSEIVAVACRHDPEYASKLIARIDNKSDENRELLSRESIEKISERGALYVEMAYNLLNEGDQKRAIDLAKRSLTEGRSARFIWFLNELRKRDPAAADGLFLDVLSILRQTSADPNDVLFFGLYLFYPGRIAVGSIDGQVIVSQGIRFSAAPDPPPNLVRPYLQTAADVLLRFSVIPGQPGFAGAVELKRFALQQLLPLFERYTPERAAALRAELARLGSPAPPDAVINFSSEPFVNVTPDVTSIGECSTTETIAEIEKLTDARERDHYLCSAAKCAIDRKQIEDARQLATRINNADLRKSLLELIAFFAAQRAIERNNLEEAEKIASSQLNQEKRAVIYFQLASAWLERSDYARANELVNAAITDAAKTEDHAQRARIYIHLAAGIARRDALRAFELTEAAVKDINAAEQFNPADNQIAFLLRTPRGASYRFVFSQGASLLSVMSPLAKSDLYRTLTLARSIRLAALRAHAVIAACRAVLAADKKPVEAKVNPTSK